MELGERILFLGIGGGVGFILGYIVARLREIKEELDEVVEHQRNEDGYMKPTFVQIMAVIAVLLTAYAAFSSGAAANKANKTSDRLEAVVFCNKAILTDFLDAVEPRTTAGQNSNDANADLQEAWFEFVQFQLHVPPYPEAAQRAKAAIYVKALKSFLGIANTASRKVAENPYPTTEQLDKCISDKERHQ